MSKCLKINIFVWQTQSKDNFHCQIEDANSGIYYKATVTYDVAEMQSHL